LIAAPETMTFLRSLVLSGFLAPADALLDTSDALTEQLDKQRPAAPAGNAIN
jgi:hypothetical protein